MKGFDDQSRRPGLARSQLAQQRPDDVARMIEKPGADHCWHRRMLHGAGGFKDQQFARRRQPAARPLVVNQFNVRLPLRAADVPRKPVQQPGRR